MGKGSSAAVGDAFVAEAAGAFRFLVDDHAMTGPEVSGVVLPVVTFGGAGLRYRIILDSGENSVFTRVETELGDRTLVAELADLVQAAGLDSRNHVATGAVNLRNLRRSLSAQAGYVRALHPRLASDRLVELMRAATAREWRAG